MYVTFTHPNGRRFRSTVPTQVIEQWLRACLWSRAYGRTLHVHG